MSQNGSDKTKIHENLKNFEFKEVLNSNPDRKAIFILLEHSGDKSQGILICDKHAFEETSVAEWVVGATLRYLSANDIYGNYEALLPDKFNEVKTTFIHPATDRHIQKYKRQDFFLLNETPNDYKELTLPFIKESQLSLKWVYNFLDKKAEADRIVFEDPDKEHGFILAPDLKWNGENVDELYLQAVVNRRDLHSVRGLTEEELPLLINIRDRSAKVVLEKYSLKRSQLKMYFHYQPSYYHLHVHIVNVKYDAPGLGCTSLLLDQVISNIELKSDFYQKATLAFISKESHPLFKKFSEAGRV